MTYRFMEVNGGDLCYEVRGHGHPLLLLHAGIADSRMWDDQVEPFAQHFQVIRYDIRGWGRSPLVPGPLAHHEDAAALLGALGIENAHVLGVSIGGYVAVDLALAHPEMVTALVLGAPIVSGYEPSSEEIQRFGAQEREALDRGDLDAATEVNLRMWVDGPERSPHEVDPSVRERVREMQLLAFSNPIPEGVDEQELALPALGRLSDIQVPTLIIIGQRDVGEFQELAQMVAGSIPGAKTVEIAGTAHLPSMEKPRIFNGHVLRFLTDQPPRRAAERE
jgi:pimeloyl-ACP methyl ester carboxylesterase